MSNAQLDQITDRVDILVLEDQETQLTTLVSQLETIPHAHVRGTREYEEAEACVIEGGCDVYVTDLRIHSQTKAPYQNAGKILHGIKTRGTRILSVATSMWDTDLRQVERDAIADAIVAKPDDQDGSMTKMAAEKLVGRLLRERQTLNDFLIDLFEATTSIDLASAAKAYINAKNAMRDLVNDSELPDSMRKTFWALQKFVFHLSPIDAPTLKLQKLTPEAFSILNLLLQDLVKPLFSYKENALAALGELEAHKYQVYPRVVI